MLVPLSEVIRGNIHKLYAGMELTATTLFRLTRDAEIEIDDDSDEALRDIVQAQIRQRRYEPVVRLEFAPGADPSIRENFALPTPQIRDIDDYDRKLAALAEAYLDHDVRSIAGATCWFGVLFDRVLAAARARGRRPVSVRDVWPNLRVLFGGGVNAEAYRGLIEARVGRDVALIDNYNATEGGALAVSDRPGDLLVLPDRGVFFEFVPNGQAQRRVPLWEVDVGVEYDVVVTTSGGSSDIASVTSSALPRRFRIDWCSAVPRVGRSH